MRKLLVPVAFGVALVLMGLSGCKVYSTTGQPDQTEELERLRAELAAAKAAQNSGARPPAPAPGPRDMSADAKKRLGAHDIKVTTAGDKIKMTLPNKILFSSGSAALRSDSKKPLDEAAKVIKHEFASSDLIIQGHTDNQPIKHSANKWSSNDELSVARAKAVATALQKAGVKNRVKIEGLGESKPLNENRTPEERAANRRVEILIGTHGAAREKAPAAPASGMEEDLGS